MLAPKGGIMRTIVLCLLLTGCAGAWYKDGSTERDFNMDRGQCNAQAYSAPDALQRAFVFRSCMEGKGWTRR